MKLTQNEPDIQRSTSIEQTADLTGDKLLIIRNFASEAIRRATQRSAGTVADAWEVIKPEFQEGARTAARMLAPLALIALVTSLAGPVAGLAGLLRGDIFKTVHNAISQVQKNHPKGSG